jgi:rod shape-determining protein MreC
LAIFSLNVFKDEVRNFFYSISNPFQNIFNEGISISSFLEGVKNINEIKLENESLVSENKRIISEINSLKDLKRENEELRKALELNLQESFELLEANFASIINSGEIILLNKGYEDGVLENYPVITSEKNLVGKVKKSYKNFSSVELISSKDISFNVEVVPKDYLEGNLDIDQKYQALANGINDSKLIVKLVSKNLEIKKGDLVFTTGSEGFFPKGLLVGYVEEIKKDDVEPFQEILVKPELELMKKETLFLITNY